MKDYYKAYLNDEMSVEDAYSLLWNMLASPTDDLEERREAEYQLRLLQASLASLYMASKGYTLVSESDGLYLRK